MAIGTISAIAGGVAGIAKSLSGTKQESKMNLGEASAYEQQAQAAAGRGLSEMGDLVGAGPGAADVSAGAQSGRDLAAMLQDYQKSGGIPGAEDITQGQTFAGRMFNQRRFDLAQNFEQQRQEASQQAALMGRNPLDPVLRNKMAQEQTRQQGSLQAEQSDFATRFAMDQPGKRLGFAERRAGVLQGLASQAMANRQALFSMGQQGLAQQQDFRLRAAGKTTTGGAGNEGAAGLAGGLMGALGGYGEGARLQAGQEDANFFRQMNSQQLAQSALTTGMMQRQLQIANRGGGMGGGMGSSSFLGYGSGLSRSGRTEGVGGGGGY